jgi:ABC-type glycerol-3-phosphate transport system permease component
MTATTQPADQQAPRRSLTWRQTLVARRHRYLGDAATYLILLALGAGSILPLLWMLSTSLKDTGAFYIFPPQFVPPNPTLRNYVEFFQRGAWLFLRNSAIIALAVTAVAVAASTMAGYALAKIPFPGRTAVFILMLSGLMIPWEVTIIPLFLLIVQLGWVNTFQGVILPMCASPFGILVMRQFLLSVPSELMDAARLDGASEFGIFWRIVVPISKPAIAALSTLVFLSSWNAFLWPLIASSRNEMRTLPVAVALFQQQYTASYGLMMAAATVAFVPALITFLTFQRYFVQGITMSGFKG